MKKSISICSSSEEGANEVEAARAGVLKAGKMNGEADGGVVEGGAIESGADERDVAENLHAHTSKVVKSCAQAKWHKARQGAA